MSRHATPINELAPLFPPVDHRDIQSLRAELLELRNRLESVEKLLLAYVGDCHDQLG